MAVAPALRGLKREGRLRPTLLIFIDGTGIGRDEALVDAVLETVDLSVRRVALVSDHGNLEESGHDRPTLNLVPLLSWGHGAHELIDAVTSMEELTPALVAV